MIKRLILSTAVLFLAGCNDMTAWVVTGQDTDLTTRLGVEAIPGVEAGMTAKWGRSSEIEWGPEPQQLGLYAIYEASWVIGASDVGPKAPPPFPLLEGLVAVPYAGVDVVDDVDNGNFSNLEPNWIFGTKFLLDPDGKLAVIAEYIDGDQTRSDVNLGIIAAY